MLISISIVLISFSFFQINSVWKKKLFQVPKIGSWLLTFGGRSSKNEKLVVIYYERFSKGTFFTSWERRFFVAVSHYIFHKNSVCFLHINHPSPLGPFLFLSSSLVLHLWSDQQNSSNSKCCLEILKINMIESFLCYQAHIQLVLEKWPNKKDHLESRERIG